jgi:hypothetical protein
MVSFVPHFLDVALTCPNFVQTDVTKTDRQGYFASKCGSFVDDVAFEEFC